MSGPVGSLVDGSVDGSGQAATSGRAATAWLFALDMDGTLLGPDKRVSRRNADALAALVAAGHHAVAVTGRSRRSALPLLEDTPAIELVAGSNGAYLHRVASGALEWSHPIPVEQAARWAETVRARLPEASLGWESEEGIVYEPAFLELVGDPVTIDPGAAGEAPLPGALYKLFLRTPRVTGGELQRLVAALLGGAAEVSTSGVPFVEMTMAGVDKGAALERVAGLLGVPLERTVVFGDNLNDVPMFRRAGTGVAMGNAVAEVCTLADRVAPSNADDGVAAVIEAWLRDGSF